MTSYTISAVQKGSIGDPRGIHSLAVKNWPSVCGHLGHMEEDYENILVFREPEHVLVLRYDMDGHDL